MAGVASFDNIKSVNGSVTETIAERENSGTAKVGATGVVPSAEKSKLFKIKYIITAVSTPPSIGGILKFHLLNTKNAPIAVKPIAGISNAAGIIPNT